MKDLRDLSQEEMMSYSGGETGWYYLGRAVRAVEDFFVDPARNMPPKPLLT